MFNMTTEHTQTLTEMRQWHRINDLAVKAVGISLFFILLLLLFLLLIIQDRKCKEILFIFYSCVSSLCECLS